MPARRNKRQGEHQKAIQAFNTRQKLAKENQDDSVTKHELQARLAKQSESVTTLRKNSLARRVAYMVLDLFPSVEPEIEDEVEIASRTSVACRVVRSQLSPKERTRSAVNFGFRQANSALQNADHYIKTYRHLALEKVDNDGSTLTHI